MKDTTRDPEKKNDDLGTDNRVADTNYRCPGCARMHAINGCYPNCGAQ